MPRELGGANGRGTLPERLFTPAHISSFLGMLRAACEGCPHRNGASGEGTPLV